MQGRPARGQSSKQNPRILPSPSPLGPSSLPHKSEDCSNTFPIPAPWDANGAEGHDADNGWLS